VQNCEKFRPLNEHFFKFETGEKRFILATQGIILSAFPDLDSPIIPLVRPVLLEVIGQQKNHQEFAEVRFTEELLKTYPGTFYLHGPLENIRPLSESPWE